MGVGANTAIVQIDDIIVPETFSPYIQQLSEEKSRLIQSGAMSANPVLDGFLAGGGLTFDIPSLTDLDADSDNVSTDDISDRIAATIAGAWPGTGLDSTPEDINSAQEIAVRLSRNNSWNTSDLAAALAGTDPAAAIGERVANYRARRLQKTFIATWQGVFKDNAVNDSGDYVYDISGGDAGGFVDGVTNFSAEAFIDTKVTMGDSMEDLTMLMVHSVVYARMLKNNLIDFIPDAVNPNGRAIPTFLGVEVVVDDGMPAGDGSVGTSPAVVYDDGSTSTITGVYESWLFGTGAAAYGSGMPKVATEIERQASAGNGGGSETLHNRWEWIIHPVGHAFTAASIANGGPSNAATTNNLNHVSSWNRVYSERKMIKAARLVTREAA